jgi:hypothetical protein
VSVLAIPYLNLAVSAYLFLELVQNAKDLTPADWGEFLLLAVVLRQVNTKVTPRIQEAVNTKLSRGKQIGPLTVEEASTLVRQLAEGEVKGWEGVERSSKPVIGMVAVDTLTGEIFITRSGNNVFAPKSWNPRVNDYMPPEQQIPGGQSYEAWPLGNCAEPRMVNALAENGNVIGSNIIAKIFGIRDTKSYPVGVDAPPCPGNCQTMISNTQIQVVTE